MGRNKRLSAKKRQRERDQREKREIKAEQRAKRKALRKGGVDPDSPEGEAMLAETADDAPPEDPDVPALPWPPPKASE